MPVARSAADAAAFARIALVQHHAQWRVERLQSGQRKIFAELLNPRLVADRRVGKRFAAVRLGGVFPAISVHLVQLFVLLVVRLKLVVANWPGRRDAAVVLQFAEVLLAKP